jgi:hypothetical protein
MEMTNMKLLLNLYEKHESTTCPDLRGKEVNGINLLTLDADSIAVILSYLGSSGNLNELHRRILKQCHLDLNLVVKDLEPDEKLYFSSLRSMINTIIEVEQKPIEFAV